MRLTRIRMLKIQRKKRNKMVLNFLVLLPFSSIIMGYLITDLLILPSYYR